MNRVIILLLCIMLVFVGCTKSGDASTEATDSSTPEPTGTEVSSEYGKIVCVKNGAPVFKICYATDEYLPVAESLAQTLNRKTKVDFPISTHAGRFQEGPMIYVGYSVSDDQIVRLYEENFHNNTSGMAAVYAEGNIYLMGYTPAVAQQAAQRFISEMIPDYITVNEQQQVEAYFSETMFFIKVEQNMNVWNLNGTNILEYRIVMSKEAGKDEQQVVNVAVKNFATVLGKPLDVVDDSTKPGEHEIVVGNTSREKNPRYGVDGKWHNGLFAYSVDVKDGQIAIGYGGFIGLYAALEYVLNAANSADGTITSFNGSVKENFLSRFPVSRTDENAIRVISSNVLFGCEDFHLLSGALRSKVTGEYVLAFEPDSVGFQECLLVNQQSLREVAGDLYEFVPFDTNFREQIMYRKDKYEIVEYGFYDLEGINYEFVWVALKNRQTGEVYVHANLHYHYISDEARIAHAKDVNREVKVLLEKYADAPIVITGDYNSTMDSIVHQTMTEGTTLANAMQKAPAGMADTTYKSNHPYDGYEDPNIGKNACIDHVYVNEATTDVKLHRIIYDHFIIYTSDHYLVLVEVSKK